MKKSLVAAALSAVLAPAAFAQTNVTLYGIADAGVSGDRTGGSGFGTTVRVNSGYMSSSRFGVTGTEDLGAGLKGVFTLEMGYDIDTGGFKQYRGNPGNVQPSPQNQQAIAATDARGTNIFGGFNRRSFVGLQGGFGTVALGRDYTPFFWAQLATDTLGYGLYGNLLNLTSVTGGGELFHRASNALFYTSPKFAGLTLRGTFSAGGESFGASTPAGTPVALPRRANQLFGVGAEYGLGPVVVTAAIQEVRLANTALTPATTPGVTPTTATFTGGTSDRRDWVVGAKLNLGLFGLAGGYARVDPQGRPRAEQAWVGASVGIGRGSALFQVQRIRQDFALATTARGTADTASLSFTYPFSRRTTGYATYGYVRNNATSAIALNASDNSLAAAGAGADPRGFAVGVRHSF